MAANEQYFKQNAQIHQSGLRLEKYPRYRNILAAYGEKMIQIFG